LQTLRRFESTRQGRSAVYFQVRGPPSSHSEPSPDVFKVENLQFAQWALCTRHLKPHPLPSPRFLLHHRVHLLRLHIPHLQMGISTQQLAYSERPPQPIPPGAIPKIMRCITKLVLKYNVKRVALGPKLSLCLRRWYTSLRVSRNQSSSE
jgi:hypothetical protein